ncbi:zinc finger protein GLI2a isoform X5 [Syngnathoides biaculeatus]|uniref:zinc finger protein GLI2a isoform X5 n=1 Tax=Syngnathoides biaculeatus TaxID=300417 RepID=UPI002ADE0C8C|nr:zinc finger protein GLI2a isoform X5 [Syngnathoides biaculeatus]
METSAPTATEKKESKGPGLDGSSFSEISNKPSPTSRGAHHIFPTFHTPIPINMRHHEGRYHYEPHPLHTAQGPPGLTGSPVISDISLIRLSPHGSTGPGESPFSPPHPYVSPHMEHYLRSVHGSPTLSMISAARGLSPAEVNHEHLKDRALFTLPPPPPGANPTEYYHLMASASQRNPYGDLLMQSGAAAAMAAAAAAAAHLPDYISPVDVSRFSSPRVTPRLSRKRALSISPLSDASIDLQTMIRTSPNSLVAYINNSRSSSAASSSYGHLSVGGISPSFSFPHSINPVAYQQLLSQQRSLNAFGHTPPLIQPPPSSFSARQHSLATPPLSTTHNSTNSEANQNPSGDPAVSSTVNQLNSKRTKVKMEVEGPLPMSPTSLDHSGGILDLSEDLDKDECKQEPETIYETNCHWEFCTKEYDTQDQLVHHINNDHIHGEKKEFVCRWMECSRGQKPFKAQYMLVVHMRRHTGEKPHKCTMYQSSPGSHSSCRSQPSPLSSTNNNDSGVEMAIHSGGSFGDLSVQDDCAMVDSTLPAGGQHAGFGLQLRKVVGHSGTFTVKMETIKKERLKTVRDSCPWVSSAPQPLQAQCNNTKLPPIVAVGSPLENSNLTSNLNSLHNGQRLGDQSLCEVTLLNQLNDRRNSTTSTISSAYTMSRRSSGISPCYSSRRSSEASQFGANRHNNISSADSYDPISTDLSRRSSEASQCGGGGFGGAGGGNLPSLLSLTPAQHYCLKAKYAAAIGGAPPTPLPNMDRMSLKMCKALNRHSQECSSHQYLLPPSATMPRRCSDIGYDNHSMMPHEVPGSLPRRASDPVRRPTLDSLALSAVQRYNSMNSMNSSSEYHRSLAMQGYTRSDGNLQRYPFTPRPPSISENVAMENMAVDGMGTGGEQSPEDDIVLPDDMVQYLRSQNPGTQGHHLVQGNYQFHNQSQGYQTGIAPLASFYSQRRVAMVDACMRQSAQGIDHSDSQKPFSASSHMNKNNMPVQWNEVTSGTVDTIPKPPKQQHSLRGNLAVVSQRNNFGSFQAQGQSLCNNQQAIPMSQHMHKQGYANHNPKRLNNPHHQQRQYSNLKYSDQSLPQGLSQDTIPNSISASNNVRPTRNAVMIHGLQSYRVRAQADEYFHINNVVHQQQHNNISTLHGNVPNNTSAMLLPRPPGEPKPGGTQHFGTDMMQLDRIPKLTDVSPGLHNDTSEASPKRPNQSDTQQNNSEYPNSEMFYTGAIHLFEQTPVTFNASISPNMSQTSNNIAASNMASPGVNQVSSSTVDSSTSGNGGAEHTQIDFDSILDDGDHSSLMSGTLSPGLLQSLSQNSSRLTTPRNSVTLASFPTGIGNMAIGDMSSMLTALAEESKFLNMIS